MLRYPVLGIFSSHGLSTGADTDTCSRLLLDRSQTCFCAITVILLGTLIATTPRCWKSQERTRNGTA